MIPETTMPPTPSALLATAALLGSRGVEAVVAPRHNDGQFPSFDAFVQLSGREYGAGSEEYVLRRRLYENVLVDALAHNNRSERLWTAGVNPLWDRTDAELSALRGWDGSARPAGGARAGGSRAGGAAARGAHRIGRPRAFLQRGLDDDDQLPDSKVWSGLSMARHVRNQGGCGSCWAIATATVLEGHAEIHGKPRTFSAQQIVSCTPNPRECGGQGGCRGATAELGMDWVLKNGCAEEAEVPYQGVDSACTVATGSSDAEDPESSRLSAVDGSGQVASAQAAAFGMTGWETLPLNEYGPLLRALAGRGPVAVSVSASPWQMYESGIFDGCPRDAVIDHAVTAIGYGKENGNKYWVIQNSWGRSWGEEGHIRLLRHDEGDLYCGTNHDPEKGVACKGETKPVPVCGMCGVLFDSVVPHFGN